MITEQNKTQKAVKIVDLLLKKYNNNYDKVEGFIDGVTICFNQFDNEFIQKVESLFDKIKK